MTPRPGGRLGLPLGSAASLLGVDYSIALDVAGSHGFDLMRSGGYRKGGIASTARELGGDLTGSRAGQ